MSKTLEELAPIEKTEQLTEAAKRLTVEDLQSIHEVFGNSEESKESGAIPLALCCCCI